MQKTQVESQSINWVAYEEDEQTLVVEYSSGATYRYFDVSPSTYEWLLKAESKGKFMNRLVKDNYRYERVDSDPSPPAQDLTELLSGSLKGSKPDDSD